MYGSIETLDEINHTPSNEEIALIKEKLNRARHALQQTVAERAILARRGKELGCLVKKLEAQIQYDSLALAPHQKLSRDILRRIFEFCCSAAMHFPNYRLDQAPQKILSRVCSSWHQVVLQTPQLWNNVLLEFNYHDVSVCEVASAAHAWLSLGKAVPGCLEILTRGGKEDATDVILDLIATYKPKELHLSVFDTQLTRIMELPKDAGLSCVQEMHILNILTSDPYSNAAASLTHDDKLTDLTAVRICVELPNSQLIPWHQLRHVEMRTYSPSSLCLDIIRQSSAVLETCDLRISDDLMETLSMQPIRCVNLRHLKIKYYTGGQYHLDRFLGQLRMPKLKSLCIDGGSSCLNLSTLSDLQEQSGMSLEELVIPLSRDKLDVGALLRCMPSLRRINLPETASLDDKTIEELSTGSMGYYLEEFYMSKYFTIAETDKVLQMVKARAKCSRPGPSSFKHIKLCFDHGATHTAKMVKKIRMLGVELTMDSVITVGDPPSDDFSSSDSGSEL